MGIQIQRDRDTGMPRRSATVLGFTSCSRCGHYHFRANALRITLVAAIELRVYPTRESLHGLVSVVDRSDPDLYGS